MLKGIILSNNTITTSPVLTFDSISVWGELVLDMHTEEWHPIINFCRSGGTTIQIAPILVIGLDGLPLMIATHSLYYIVQNLVKTYNNAFQGGDGGLPVK